MEQRLFGRSSFSFLLGGIFLAALFFTYLFFSRAFNDYSYLIETPNGVFRKIALPTLYHRNFLGMIYGVSFLAALALLALFTLLPYRVKEKKEPQVIESKEDRISMDLGNIFYSREPISDEMIESFIRTYPESALKFVAQQNIDGSPLDVSVRSLHQSWVIRGMKKAKVSEEILRITGWDNMPERSLYEISLELKDAVANRGFKETELHERPSEEEMGEQI